MTRRPRPPALLLLLVGLSFAACARPGPKHEYELTPGRAYDATQRNVLIVPINTTNPPVQGMRKGEKSVFELIQDYVTKRGLLVQVADAAAHERAATEAAYAVRREQMSGESTSVSRDLSYADLVPHILDGLESGADLVVVPNMVMRSAVWSSKSLRWDGVRRRTPGVGGMTMSGTGNGVSLHVAIYSDDGTRVFSGFGGLDVIWAINRSEEKMDLIPDRLEDIDNLREGVCVAFHPFFGDESCR